MRVTTERIALTIAARGFSASAAAIVTISRPPKDVMTASRATAIPASPLGAKPPWPPMFSATLWWPGSGPDTIVWMTRPTPTRRKMTIATTLTMDSIASMKP